MTVVAVTLLAAASLVPWSLRRQAGSLATSDGEHRAAAPASGVGAARADSAVRAVGGVRGTPGLRRVREDGDAEVGRASGAGAEPALLLDLVAVAIAAGAALPAALAAVGMSWPGTVGDAVVRAARGLELGAPWEVAWAGAPPAAAVLGDALAPSWLTGASPVPLLRAAADRSRAARRAATRAAAGRLGVQLVLPLGLCFLPAFMLLGLVPVVISLASGLFG